MHRAAFLRLLISRVKVLEDGQDNTVICEELESVLDALRGHRQESFVIVAHQGGGEGQSHKQGIFNFCFRAVVLFAVFKLFFGGNVSQLQSFVDELPDVAFVKHYGGLHHIGFVSRVHNVRHLICLL